MREAHDFVGDRTESQLVPSSHAVRGDHDQVDQVGFGRPRRQTREKDLSAKTPRDLVAMVLGVRLGRLGRMMRRVVRVPVRGMGMVRGRFVVTGVVVRGRLVMVTRRVLVMFRCFAMVVRCLLGHENG